MTDDLPPGLQNMLLKIGSGSAGLPGRSQLSACLLSTAAGQVSPAETPTGDVASKAGAAAHSPCAPAASTAPRPMGPGVSEIHILPDPASAQVAEEMAMYLDIRLDKLRECCRERGLKDSGTREELVSRLLESRTP